MVKLSFGVVGAAVLLGIAACSPEAANEEAATPAPAATATTAPAAPPPPSKLKEIESPGAARDAAGYRTDMTEIAIAPAGDPNGDDKLEHMFRMKEGDHLVYAWEALDADGFWHEFHGHTEDAVTFYKKADGAKHQGALIAPFDGIHGWYFENRTGRPVIVRLRTSGFYTLEPKGG